MYFEIEEGRNKSYHKWFALAKLREKEEELIKSDDVFYEYIKAPGFILFTEARRTLQN